MKKFFLFLLVSSVLFSCKKGQIVDEHSKVVLLKVDYLSSNFEGGTELKFPRAKDFTIAASYKAPGDFGSVQLFYKEVNEKIFDGSIIWMGTGAISYPVSFTEAKKFSTIAAPLPVPDENSFDLVIYESRAYYPPAIDYGKIWTAISSLQIVSDYRKSNPKGKINLFLYTPSVGVGNPADWDWFVILNN